MKKILYILLLYIPLSMSSQTYEVFAGGAISLNDKYTLGYSAGMNFHFDLKRDYEVSRRGFIFGFEHSGFFGERTDKILPHDQETPESCENCEASLLGTNSGTELEYKFWSRGVGFNIGAEFIWEGFYIIADVNQYQNITKINGETVADFYQVYVGGGAKYLFKTGNYWISPTFKFNKQAITLSVGLAFD